MAFIRNCWYMVAWDHEIPADGLFSRRVIGEPLLLYRKADGDIVALADRCCHRLAPLSGVHEYPSRVKCATLPWHALIAALDHSEKEASSE